jgi:HTH-type transcriptional repressor of NAD biosynthesis genes
VKTGLVLGKFAPFHRGHAHLIETALGEMDRVVVLVYQALRTTRVPLDVRAGWIRAFFEKRYPGRVEVMEAAGGPEETGLDTRTIALQNEYLRKRLFGRSFDTFYSSEAYGEHVSWALGCRNRPIDPSRKEVRVSASVIRRCPEDFGALALAPREYVLRRLVLLGGPSTGKSTLAEGLGAEINEPVAREYGREYWFEHQDNHRLSMEDLEIIARRQIGQVDPHAVSRARNLVIHDGSPLTTLCYARYYFGQVSEALRRICDEYCARDNLIHVVCGEDIPFEDSWDRSGPGSRRELQALNLRELEERGLEYELIEGDPVERIHRITTILEQRRAECPDC